MADEPRNARIGHHGGGEHRVGRRQQRAEQARLEPAQPHDPVRGEGDDRARDRHRQRELAERQVPGLLEHLGLDLEAVAEQDHDQREHREVVHEARARVEVEHLQAAMAEGEAGQHEGRRERQERPPHEAGDERSEHQQAAEDEQHDLEAHRVRVCQQIQRGGGPQRRAHHRARQVAVLAGRGRSVQRLPDRGGRLPPAARLRQRRVLQAAALHRLRRRRRGGDLAPARRPLPRPRPVRLRADLRAAPAARPGRPLAGHRPPRAPGAARARRARPSCSAASSAPGATRT